MKKDLKKYVLAKSKQGLTYYDVETLEWKNYGSSYKQERYSLSGNKLYVTISTCTYFDRFSGVQDWQSTKVYLGTVIYQSNKPFTVTVKK